MKYRIIGADRENGENVEMIFEANTSDAAAAKANAKGIMVAEVVPLGAAPAEAHAGRRLAQVPAGVGLESDDRDGQVYEENVVQPPRELSGRAPRAHLSPPRSTPSAPPIAGSAWFYHVGHERVGPVAEAEILSLLGAGSLTQQTLVWQDGLADWIPLGESKLTRPTTTLPYQSVRTSESEPAHFIQWYWSVIRKYATFNGRARRKEYWSFVLVDYAIFIALQLAQFSLVMLGGMTEAYWLSAVGGFGIAALTLLYFLAALMPGLAVTYRRLHDTGRSGWWWLIAIVPFAGAIIFLVFALQDSQPGENRYGLNPKRVG